MNVFDKAADRLRGRWMQGDYGDMNGDGPVCLVGAICVATKTNPYERLYKPFRDFEPPAWEGVLDITRTDGYESLVAFNDDEDTTEEDVLLYLKRAAVALDEAEEVVELGGEIREAFYETFNV